MSTIGTTLKQPRVFAHDAIALADLCGNISGTIIAPGTGAAIDPASGDIAGTGYTAGVLYSTDTDSLHGAGATVTVVSIDGVGGVDDFDITAVGANYEVGDILTVINGGSDDCQIVITEVGCSQWAFGDPITQMPSTLSPMNSVPYWNEKMAYTYTSTASGNEGPYSTPGPGAALYVGAAMDITVINEAGTEVVYKGVNAGSFLPVSVLSVVTTLPNGGTELDDILALF